MATQAGNHIYDCGPQGIADMIELATAAGIRTTGAGENLAAAKLPIISQLGALRVGLLNYNCVGPRESWATSHKAGCAFVRVLTHYELDSANPGGPPSVYSFAEPTSLEATTADIRALAAEVDVVIVALHKGMVHLPADMAAYETQLAHAAIDNGAHAVIAHHAHIMRGIEFYRGAPIFHGLGNFVTVTNALNVSGDNSPERLAWAKRRKKLFGFEPDPSMPNYAFHPESRNTAMALLELDASGTLSASFIPCWIDQSAAPRPLRDAASAAPVLAYVEAISREAGFDTDFVWDTDRVRVSPPAWSASVPPPHHH